MKAKNVLDIFKKIDTEEKAYWLGFYMQMVLLDLKKIKLN